MKSAAHNLFEDNGMYDSGPSMAAFIGGGFVAPWLIDAVASYAGGDPVKKLVGGKAGKGILSGISVPAHKDMSWARRVWAGSVGTVTTREAIATGRASVATIEHFIGAFRAAGEPVFTIGSGFTKAPLKNVSTFSGVPFWTRVKTAWASTKGAVEVAGYARPGLNTVGLAAAGVARVMSRAMFASFIFSAAEMMTSALTQHMIEKSRASVAPTRLMDTPFIATMRQASLMAIHNSQLQTRSAFGREASFLHNY